MNPVLVIQGLTAAIQLAQQLYQDYEAGKVVLSATDAQAIKDQLAQAKAISDQITPIVDAALDAASKQ